MRTLIIAALAALTLAPAVSWAGEGQACRDRLEAVARLGRSYGEFPLAIGTTFNGQLAELLVSKAGTWTFIVTDRNGRACMVASGKNWTAVPPLYPEEEEEEEPV
jgi:hypothetical protein